MFEGKNVAQIRWGRGTLLTRSQQLLHSGHPTSAGHPTDVDVIAGPGDFQAQCQCLLGTFLANNTIEWWEISTSIKRETLWIATPTELFQGYFRGGRFVLHADSSSIAWQVPDAPESLYQW
jgi:hypothetical protein